VNKSIGIFICSGCEIGKSIDTDQLKVNIRNGDPACCVVHPSMCSENGLGNYFDAIEEYNLDGTIIAACSSRFKSGIFDHEKIRSERVNIREQVAWVTEPGSEDSLMAAEDYIKMGMAKLSGSLKPIGYKPDSISSEILVVGAGITGITAATAAAAAGYFVHLIEKEERPGGYASRLSGQIPYKPPYNRLSEPSVIRKIEELGLYTNIQLYTSTTVKSISGQPGDFEVILDRKPEKRVRVGAIVSAMGWKPYDATRLSGLGYGTSPGVITNLEFEILIAEKRYRELPRRILFIQCAGSRDPEHLPYCSNYCCGTTLRQAYSLRKNKPDAEVYIIYKDMRTPGLHEEFYQNVQADDGIMMSRGEVKTVNQTGENLEVVIEDSLIDEVISIQTDMVVLATGMVPAGTEDLNLQYRLGKGLPELKYNFPDSHFICFPYETRRTGIYAAGSIRAPMDIPSSMEDAEGAAFKAIQCIEAVKRGEAVHPRSGDQSYPEMYMERCTDCKRCTEECPFGSYDENEKGTPLPNPARCRRCGICLGSCPERVISFADYSINMMSEVIKSIPIPDEFEEKPRILVFVCENDAYPALDMAGAKKLRISPYVRIIPVRCLGSINKVWISDALSKGYDGILQIGCKPGDDYQCHFIHGSELTKTRGENIQETLLTMMLETERIRTEFVEINEYERIAEIINNYVEEIELIGPNPFKDM